MFLQQQSWRARIVIHTRRKPFLMRTFPAVIAFLTLLLCSCQSTPDETPPLDDKKGNVHESANGNMTETALTNLNWEWKQLESGTGMPDGGYRAVHDSARNLMVMYGGRGGDPAGHTAVWEFDGMTLRRRQTDNHPGERHWHGMVYDTTRNKIVLFGGQDNGADRNMNDTWEFDGSDWQRIETVTSPPNRRFEMAYDERRGISVVFHGGIDGTWEYDGLDWRKVPTTAGPQHTGRMIYHPEIDAILHFGSGDERDETWLYSEGDWQRISRGVAGLKGRWFHDLAYDSEHGLIIMFGGYAPADNKSRNDAWVYDGDTWLELIAESPPPRMEQHTMVFYPKTSSVYVYAFGNIWTLQAR